MGSGSTAQGRRHMPRAAMRDASSLGVAVVRGSADRRKMVTVSRFVRWQFVALSLGCGN